MCRFCSTYNFHCNVCNTYSPYPLLNGVFEHIIRYCNICKITFKPNTISSSMIYYNLSNKIKANQ